MCWNLNRVHTITLNRVKFNPTIPPLNLTWDIHLPPSKFITGNSSCPPYHLGLSPDFTGELPGVCMPYQVLQPYALLHANIFAPLHFFFSSSVFMVTSPSPSVASSSHLSMLAFFPCLSSMLDLARRPAFVNLGTVTLRTPLFIWALISSNLYTFGGRSMRLLYFRPVAIFPTTAVQICLREGFPLYHQGILLCINFDIFLPQPRHIHPQMQSFIVFT